MPGRGLGREQVHDAAWSENYPHPMVSCLMPLIAIMCMIAVVVFGFQVWEWALPNSVKVPKVVGLKQGDAVSILKEEGLQAEVYRYAQPSETIPEGAVISSDPVAGRDVKVGRSVRLVISAGSAYTQVPDVSELPLVRAREKLREAGLLVSAEELTWHDTIGMDRVVSISPGEGARVKRNSTVGLVVSRGPKVKTESRSSDIVEDVQTTVITVDLPENLDDPTAKEARIDVIDANGRTMVYQRAHSPGDTITHTVQGSGDAVTVEVFFDDKLILTRKL